MDELASPLALYARRHHRDGAPTGAPMTTAPTADANLDRRYRLVRSVGEECQSEQELRNLLNKKAEFNLYDGFEPSGRMHIAQGVFKCVNVNKCTKAGGRFIFWVADWFALMNDKMGGDLQKIQTVGQYFVEVWKATGMDMSRVEFRWCAHEIAANAEAYWSQALDVASKSTLNRIKKCCTIMGRGEEGLTAAQILYPIMQCTDIFFLKADICQLGVDQRKVNMLARDYCDAAKRKEKPIILSHHMIYGLKEGQAKMSKSDPDSAIFMEDTPEDVERKIRNAHCPRVAKASEKKSEEESIRLVEDDLMNPCLDYLQHILFANEEFVLTTDGRSYNSFEDAKAAFISGAISEERLKDALIAELNKLIQPVRHHFATDPNAKEILAKVTQYKKETVTKTFSLKRLAIQELQGKPVFAVFVPLPTASVRMEDTLAVLNAFRTAPHGCTCVLWLEDWTAFGLGRLGGNKAAIKGFYDLFVHGLKSLEPELMKRVQVLSQGESIVSNPSDYWISVINAGRRISIKEIDSLLPPGESLEYASQVVRSLMHIGDVLALGSGSTLTLGVASGYHAKMHELAAGYFKLCALETLQLQDCQTVALRLLPDGEGLEANVNVMLSDQVVEVNKKIKQAFCQPANILFNPLILWTKELLVFQKQLKVTRKPDNGGDKVYTDIRPLTADFESGELHPGDLKPAVGKLINATLEALRPGLQDAALKKALKDLDMCAKAAAKK